MARKVKHRLILIKQTRFLRWLPTCACGWTGSYARSRQADAETMYHEHVATRTVGYCGPARRTPTPVAKLPSVLRPPARECEMGGEPNGRAWQKVSETGPTECHWCRLPFMPERPPTEDHIVPISSGGTRADGMVLSCQACNSARGNTDFAEYTEAVVIEHERAAAERREYRRPRYRLISGEWVLAAMTKRELREARALA